MNNNFWTILKYEYTSRVKTKTFIISTILTPILFVVWIALPSIILAISLEKTQVKIGIVDKSSIKIGREVCKNDSTNFFMLSGTIDEINQQLLEEKFNAYVVIDDESIKNKTVKLFTSGGGGLAITTLIQKRFDDAFNRHNLVEAGIDTNALKIIQQELKIESTKVTRTGTQKDNPEFYSFAGFFGGIIIFVLINLYGSSVIRGVIEEKANRIVEILVSSAKPFDIMLGKIVGIGSVGLTQVLIWIVLTISISLVIPNIISMFQSPNEIQTMMNTDNSNLFQSNFQLPQIHIGSVFLFVLYFIFGYFLFSSLLAGLGSAVDQEQDAQYLISVVYVPMLLPFIFMWNVVAEPNGSLAIILSLIPFSSPMLMPIRIISTAVPFWQILLSLLLLLLTTLLCIWISAKIYRIGILSYGKKPKFKEIFQWLKQA